MCENARLFGLVVLQVRITKYEVLRLGQLAIFHPFHFKKLKIVNGQ